MSKTPSSSDVDSRWMLRALRFAQLGYGTTSPNPMVGAVLVKGGKIIGHGWHLYAGGPHAEIEAIQHAQRLGNSIKGATLYVTLEPCSTYGRTPPCTTAIAFAGIKRVVIGAMDPNPKHSGRALKILERAGIAVTQNVQQEQCIRLNEAFCHWIVHRTPFVIVKAAMTLDGKIATASGQSKWITSARARAYGMRLRQGADAILVGINTVLADDPSLTVRSLRTAKSNSKNGVGEPGHDGPPGLRRVILDGQARTPLKAKVVSDEHASLTTIVVSELAPKPRVSALARKVKVMVAPRAKSGRLDLCWLMKRLGSENVLSLLVEGGGEVNASFLLQGLAHRIAFFYAPKVLGGREALHSVSGEGINSLAEAIRLTDLEWRRLPPDLLLTARVDKGDQG